MRVAVCIVGYRNSGDIFACLTALAASTHDAFEVVICENGGPDAFAALTEGLPYALGGGQSVRAVLAPSNLGYAGGVNVCLRETPGVDAWWVLNPDTVPEPAAMAALLARLAVGDCDAVGGMLYLPDGRVQSYGGRWQAWLARAVSIGFGDRPDRAPDSRAIERSQNYLSGASMMVSRRFVDVTGPLREDYFLYCEEVEWCLRARRRGLRLGFARDARVLHRQGASTGAAHALRGRSRVAVYLGERNQILTTWDCFPRCLPVTAPAALAILSFRHAAAGAWRQLGYALSGWAAGVLGRRGPPGWTGDAAPFD